MESMFGRGCGGSKLELGCRYVMFEMIIKYLRGSVK